MGTEAPMECPAASQATGENVTAVVAQRLVRVLCGNCKTPFTPDDVTLESLGINASQLKDNTLFRANGCEECANSGYRGRMGIFEIMISQVRA